MGHTFVQKTGIGKMRMRRPSPFTRTGRHADQPGVGGTRLHGRWLLLARMLWLTMFALTLVFFSANLLVGSYGLLATFLLVANTSVWFAVSLVLFWRKSSDRAILLFSLQLVLTGGVFFPPVPLALINGRIWWGSIDLFLEAVAVVMLSFVFTFPDGRFVPSFTRWLALGWIAVSLVPVPILGAFYHYWYWWLSPPYTLVRITFYGSLALALLYRYRRRATPLQRQQIKWVVFTAAIVVGAVSLYNLGLNVLPSYFPALSVSPQLHQLASALALRLLSVLIPLSIGVALLRYRLWDIDILINRTLVYGVLTLSTVALYILIVVGLGTLLQAKGNLGLALLATGLVAVLFQPLRTRLQRAVNQLIYGERDDPYRVISRLGQRLEAALAPETVLPTIVETVAQALRLPYAAITLQQGEEVLTAASYGSARGELVRLPLVYQHEQVGELVLAPRAAGERFSPADRALLEDLARQAGMAAHAVRLTADLKRLTVDLQRERERLVTAREEERRRLRRDLHDGLGPTLATITVKAEAASDAITVEPTQARRLLEDLIGQAQTAISDIRRLVYNLRPPALDDLGLVAAIRAQALHYDLPGLHVSIEAPMPLPEQSAAVEVAAYRIVQEALTNVVRHANARSCLIRLTCDGALLLEITDDGCGIAASRRAGVGLRSMRERAEEVGGTCVVEALPDKGTRVRASLPGSVEVGQRAQEPVSLFHEVAPVEE